MCFSEGAWVLEQLRVVSQQIVPRGVLPPSVRFE